MHDTEESIFKVADLASKARGIFSKACIGTAKLDDVLRNRELFKNASVEPFQNFDCILELEQEYSKMQLRNIKALLTYVVEARLWFGEWRALGSFPEPPVWSAVS